jgi:hypothetical protein
MGFPVETDEISTTSPDLPVMKVNEAGVTNWC